MNRTDQECSAVVVALTREKDPNELTWEEVRAMGLHGAPNDEFELYDDEGLVGGDDGEMLIVKLAADGTVISSRPYGPKPPAVVLPFCKRP